MGRKVADQLVETLCRAGIRHIYAVTGDSLNEVNDAVRRAGTVRWIHVRHEETGAFAAAAEAQLNGAGCCAGSSGPGHVHLVNGLYDAHRTGCSVLAIASTIPSGQFGTGYFQETDPMRLFADCSGYNQMAITPVQFVRMLPMALQHAVSRREVAVVGLPGDLAAQDAVEGPGAPGPLTVAAPVRRPADAGYRPCGGNTTGNTVGSAADPASGFAAGSASGSDFRAVPDARGVGAEADAAAKEIWTETRAAAEANFTASFAAAASRGAGVHPDVVPDPHVAGMADAPDPFLPGPVPPRAQPVCRPSDDELVRLADMIRTSERIVLFCGVGSRAAHDEVVRLAELLKAPVAYTFKAKMDMQYDNPYEIGMTGLLGLPTAYDAMHEADLLLMLGTDFPYETFLPSDCRIVQVDIRPERLGRRARVELGLQGDVRDTLCALLPMIEARTGRAFLDYHLKAYLRQSRLMAEVAEKRGGRGTIAPEYAATLIDRMAADDAIFTVDTGMCCVWGARYFHATGRREMLGSFNHGTMANALPQAIGAALARPGQQVVALCGDGGLSMLLGDLATVVEYRLPVKLIVFDNRSLGMVKLEMEVSGLPDWQTDMVNPDFGAVAEAMGIPGRTVEDPDALEEAMRQLFAAKGPALLCVRTDPNALALPPKVEFAQMKGFALAMTRMILSGRTDEVIATARSNFKHIRELV